MSKHSYSCCWMHIVWSTDHRMAVLDKNVRIKVSEYLYEYSKKRDIYMKKNYVNPDHVHILIDLPTSSTIEEIVKLFKGSSSHWINQSPLIDRPGTFNWSRGYGAFSVSQSIVETVEKYIANQEKHHKVVNYLDEFKNILLKCNLIEENR